MVSPRSQVNDQRQEGALAGVDLMTLLLSLQCEMVEIKQKGEEEMHAMTQKKMRTSFTR